MRIVFTGGGSGGHIYPIIAVKRALDKTPGINPEYLYIGPDNFSSNIFKKEGIKCNFILSGKIRRYFSFSNFIDLAIKIPTGLVQALWYLFWFMPDIIFSKGGYGSIPVVIAGWLYRIPIIIHESDTVAGIANKLASRFAQKVIVSFEETKKSFPSKKTIVIGNPIREELINGDPEIGKEIFNLKKEKPVLLIMGGSQGAQKINEIILNLLPRLLEKCEIIHICGVRNFLFLKREKESLLDGSEENKEKSKYYHLYSFLEEDKLKHAYAVADIIISRAGAGSIFEIAALGKPSILIPLSNSASDHQNRNAQALARINGAIVLNEENLTINMFLRTIFDLIDNPEKIKTIAQNAKSFYNPNTNKEIVNEILKIIKYTS